MPRADDEARIPFDPDTQSLYCSRDGLKLEKSSHMWTEFLMCPRHGEFTMAPTVMREPTRVIGGPPRFLMVDNPDPDAGKWFLILDQTEAGMWANCDAIDKRHEDGSDYDPRESRVF